MTLERRVGARYLAMMLTGEGADELGDGRKVVSVGFQQSPRVPDDLVIFTARSDEPEPGLALAVAIRRAPKVVPSNPKTQKLFTDFVRALTTSPGDGRELHLALVVAGPQPHAEQVGKLAGLAKHQMRAAEFFALVRTPGRFDKDLVERLGFVEQLVAAALTELDSAVPDSDMVQQRTWELLSRLAVLMPRVEDPDISDWVETRNRLMTVAWGNDLAGAGDLLDRLESLAGQYGPHAGHVDLKILGRDVHQLLEPGSWGHRQAREKLRHLEAQAARAVRDCIGTGEPDRTLRLDRQAEVDALVATATGGSSVVVCGESGVGKSLLALQAARAAGAVPGEREALFLNLRHLPEQSLTLVADLGCPLEVLLGEMSAPKRLLVVDAADAAAEDRREMFTYLLRAARESEVTVVAVTAAESQQAVRDLLVEHGGGDAVLFEVQHLDNSDLSQIVTRFPELSRLVDSPRSRELLRRLVLVDLLVRSSVTDVPLSDLDAMRQVWDGLVRGRGSRDRGLPDARVQVLLSLAAQALSGGPAADVMRSLDAAALDGLRHDGLLRDSAERPWQVLPEFAHDEVRRYALAHVLLADGDPTAALLAAGAPRWALSAGRLACQALLDTADSTGAPRRGGLARIQAAFDELVTRGHGARWGDVPTEALLTLSDPAPVLADAWSDLRGGQGLRRLLRVIGQRHRDDRRILDLVVAEPVVALLLDEARPWEAGKDEAKILREWLVALILRGAPAGQGLRVRLRKRLVDACAEGQERLAEQQRVRAAERAARTPEQIEAEREFEARQRPALLASGRGRRRRRAELPDELTDAVVLELLALLGPDLDETGAQLLRQVAQDGPWHLAPAVEELCTGDALAGYGHGLLAELTEAYYLDEESDGTGFLENGIRSHHSRGPITPLSSRFHGPFLALFHTDPRAGIAVVNRMLNHAARARARTLAQAGAPWSQSPADAVEQLTTELDVSGTPRRYVGDDHVWRWFRGTGVGPYPCMSALQALEYWCDLYLAKDTRLDVLVPLLLDGCENLAMLSLVVSLIVRHLEQAGTLLDPFLAQPIIWELEAARASAESSLLAAGSDELTAPERRRWSLREAATHVTVHADAARAEQLRSVADQLVAAAEAEDATPAAEGIAEGNPATEETTDGLSYAAQARNWASALDRSTYRAHTQNGMTYITSAEPADVQETLLPVREDLRRGTEAMRLLSRYFVEARAHASAPVRPTAEELAADLQAAQDLLDNPPASSPVDPWDAAAAVAAATLHERLVRGTDLPQDAMESAVRTVLAVADGAAPPRLFEVEETYFEQGCDRSAARVLPLLLLPSAAPLRDACSLGAAAQGEDRVLGAGRRLTQALAAETRLHLARGLDPVWQEPCRPSPCYHQQALDLVLDTMRACLLGPWDPARQQRPTLPVGEPVPQFLAQAAAEDIYVSRLDAALRGLGAAAASNSCVREQARELLPAVLDAHRRSLLHEPGYDARGHHTLAAARALLQLSAAGDDQPLHDHATAYADNDTLLELLLTALAAVAEEAPTPARTARQVWPDLMTKVLGSSAAGFDPAVLAALIPTPVYEGRFMYREVESTPVAWPDALAWHQEIEAWLPEAAGEPLCVDSLVGLIESLSPTDQARTGLPWITTLVLTDGNALIRPRHSLARWLVNIRSSAADLDLQNSWQEAVDALVIAGDLTLAPYSE